VRHWGEGKRGVDTWETQRKVGRDARQNAGLVEVPGSKGPWKKGGLVIGGGGGGGWGNRDTESQLLTCASLWGKKLEKLERGVVS